jgi:hypothetical protein
MGRKRSGAPLAEAEAHLVLANAGQLHFDQRVDAAGCHWRGVDDHAARLARVGHVEHFVAGLRGRAVDGGERGAALELAEVLAARDDFLARVAAFLEIDAAEQLEVDHLRDELFLGLAR